MDDQYTQYLAEIFDIVRSSIADSLSNLTESVKRGDINYEEYVDSIDNLIKELS